MYDIENYYNAETIKEAVLLLKEHPDARIISGGSDVLIKIREGKMAGTSLVSIRDIKEIRGIRLMDSGDIFIGAATTFSHVTKDPVIQKLIPVLGEAVDQVGGPQVRNIGTIGGNVCTYLVVPECNASDRGWNRRTNGSDPGLLSGTWKGRSSPGRCTYPYCDSGKGLSGISWLLY